MNKIINFLEENEIDYRISHFGNPDYFGDGFTVKGIQIAFYFDGIGNAMKKKNILLDYMRRKRAYVCRESRFGAGYTYTIMSVFDAKCLEDHQKAVADAVEKFWQEEHARRAEEELMA